MKKLVLLVLVLLLMSSPEVYAGDCKTRDKVDWHATVSSATNVRIDCDDHKGPVGDSVGVVPAGEVIRILEVDRFQENYLVETSKGTGFIFRSFLKDIVQSPLPRPVFKDLSFDHRYYDAIAEMKQRGIVSGTSEGNIFPDAPINRVELAKILVEATMDDQLISSASLPTGVYSDVESGAWYLRYLELARQKGIMTGDKPRREGARARVRPGDGANGAEVAKMIAIAFDLSVRAPVDGEEWYEPYLEVLRSKGALPYDKPDHSVTRAEMMFMIRQVMNK
ncbi:MAG: S-layer homology domain-containing protein [Candidatus Altimarinota bacterium]